MVANRWRAFLRASRLSGTGDHVILRKMDTYGYATVASHPPGVTPDPLEEHNAGKMVLDIARGRLAFCFYYERANQSEVDLFDALYLGKCSTPALGRDC